MVAMLLRMPPSTTKYCPRCERARPVSEFYANRSRIDGLTAYCIDCSKQVNKDALLERRLEAFAKLGGKCVRCDTTDTTILQIDHVRGDGAAERSDGIYAYALYRRIMANQGQYQLLCANCNSRKRIENKECRPAETY